MLHSDCLSKNPKVRPSMDPLLLRVQAKQQPAHEKLEELISIAEANQARAVAAAGGRPNLAPIAEGDEDGDNRWFASLFLMGTG